MTRQTISNRFKENGIKCFVSSRQTELTEEQRIVRYAFFENILNNYSQQRLNSIIFSDEKTFQSDIKKNLSI